MAAYFCAPCMCLKDGCCNWFCPHDRPSPIFSTFSVIYHTVVSIIAIVGLVDDGCVSAGKTWLTVGLLTAITHIIFAIYIYFRFWSKAKVAPPGVAARDILCYDVGVFLYILVLIWTFIYGFVSKSCVSNKHEDTVAILFWIFLFFGPLLLCLSMSTECGRRPKWQYHAMAQRNQHQQQTLHYSSHTVVGVPARL